MLRTITLVAAALVLTGTLEAQCPFSSVDTTDIGTGVGFLTPPTLSLSVDATTCTLGVDVAATGCCNTFPAGQFLAVGQNVYFTPIQLPPPFYAGSEIFFVPISIFGPLSLSADIALPNDASLAGQYFFAQSAVAYFTTIGMTIDWGVTQTVEFQLQI